MKSLILSELLAGAKGVFRGDESVKLKEVSKIVCRIKDVVPGCVFFIAKMTDKEEKKLTSIIDLLVEKGAHLLIAPIPVSDSRIATFEFSDLSQFLENAGEIYRKFVDKPVIAVTGSNGKSTFNRMLQCVLGQKYNAFVGFHFPVQEWCHFFDAPEESDILLIEAANGHPGGNLYNGKILKPDVQVFTNMDWVHCHNFPDNSTLYDIVKSKIEILNYLAPTGLIYKNGDNPYYKDITCHFFQKIRTYGLDPQNDAYAENIIRNPDFSTDFDLVIEDKRIAIHLTTPGSPIILAALSAALVAWDMGFTLQEIKIGLELYIPVIQRINIIKNNNKILINDAYNASPASMRAAIDILHDYNNGRKMAVIGTMADLGSRVKQLHIDVARYINDVGKPIDTLVFIGKWARDMAAQITNPIFKNSVVLAYEDKKKAHESLTQLIEETDIALVKASRPYEFETIVDLLDKKIKIDSDDFHSDCYVVYDLNTDCILSRKNIYKRYIPAGTVKVLTALLVLEKYKPDDIFEVTEDLGPRTSFKMGEKFKIIDCLHNLLLNLNSSNLMAKMLASKCSGDIPSFVKEMNTYAKEIGMTQSEFYDPSGGSEKTRTNIRDMLVLCKRAYACNIFKTIVKTPSYSCKSSKRDWKYTNTNLLLQNTPTNKYYHPNAKGGKTGTLPVLEDRIWTMHYNLINLFEHQGREILVILNDSHVRLPRHHRGMPEGENMRFEEAARMFDSVIKKKSSI